MKLADELQLQPCVAGITMEGRMTSSKHGACEFDAAGLDVSQGLADTPVRPRAGQYVGWQRTCENS